MKQLIGQQIGQYQVESLLGEGGMGAVYRAHDLKNDRMVAIKIMLANLVNKPQFRTRFMQEAEAIGKFSSPAIVTVYDTGTFEDAPYIVMEYIEGGSLVNYMRQLDWSGAKPTVETVITVAAQVAEGLSYAHQRGLIHRDIKPGNVLLKLREGTHLPRQAIITDFGLAIQRKDGDEMDTAPFMGSLAYMSPEQCENKSLDGRSDIYALGIVLYQLTTGQLPFQINAPADIVKHLNETPLPPRLINPNLPELLETITLKAMEKKPSDRYQSAAEMAHALRQALTNPDLQTGVLAQNTNNVVTQWLDNKWVAAIVVEDRVDIHQTWTSLGENRLFIVHQYEGSQVVGIEKDKVIIGRDASSDVVLNDQSVSSKHVRLTRTPQGWNVSDLGSTNHSYLGERLLEYEQVYEWPGNEPLRIGPYFLRWQPFEAEHRNHSAAPIVAGAALAGAALAGTAVVGAALLNNSGTDATAAGSENPDLIPTYSEGEILGIAITPATLELDAEAQSLLELSITNRDATVKDITLRLEVDGRPPVWVSLSDYRMKLLPDETKNTTALVDLSQAPDILADTHIVKLIATTDKGEIEVNEVPVTVNSLEDFGLDMHPSNLQEKITCRLIISDHSNFQNEFTIMGIDDSDALAFEFDEPQNAILTNFDEQQQQIKVAPRQEAWLGFRIKPKKRPLFGSVKTMPFKMRIRTPETDWQSLNGQVEIAPRITRRILLFLLLILLLFAGAGFFGFYQYNTAKAEFEAQLQIQLDEADQRAQAAQLREEEATAKLEAARAAGATDEEIAALEAEQAAAAADAAAANAEKDALSEEVAAALSPEEIAAATAAAAGTATAVAAAWTPTPVPNNPPTDIEFDGEAITENTEIGSLVGKFTGIDPDVASAGGNTVALNRSRLSRAANQSEDFTYALVSGSGSTHNDYFEIDGDELLTAVDIDYEKVRSLSFRVALTDSAGATFEKSFTLTVYDKDDIPKLSIEDVSVSEADGTAEITVSVGGDNQDTATVDYTVSSGTAVDGTDYESSSGTFTWEKEDTDEQVIEVDLIDNEMDQPERTFVVTLSNPDNATITNDTATVTITDDDDLPVIIISDYSFNENVANGTAKITVELEGASSEIVTVDYDTTNGTALAGKTQDYISANGTLSWASGTSGAREFDVTININADDIREPDETFIVTLSNSANATIGVEESTITIVDNNELPYITISDATIEEINNGQNQEVSLTVTMTGKTTEEAWIRYTTVSDGAVSSADDSQNFDFEDKQGQVDWAPSKDGAQKITFIIAEDDIDEVNESFTVAISGNSSSVTLSDSSGKITIVDNDPKPTISFGDINSTTIAEGNDLHIPVVTNGRSSQEMTVRYSFQPGTDGDPAESEDYSDGLPASQRVLTWAPMAQDPVEIILEIPEENLYEHVNESFIVTLLPATNATTIAAPQNSQTFFIQNRTALPTIETTIDETIGEPEDTDADVVVTVQLSHPSTQAISVRYNMLGQDDGNPATDAAIVAITGGDVVSATKQLTWAAQNTYSDPAEKTFNIKIKADNIYEVDETFLLHPYNSQNVDASSLDNILVTIENSDLPPKISVSNINPNTIYEDNGPVVVELESDRMSSRPFTIAWNTAVNSAAAPNQQATSPQDLDFTTQKGSFSFPANSTTGPASFSIALNNETIHELDESFLASYTSALDNIKLSEVITITNNDDPPIFSMGGNVTVTENDGTSPVRIPVTLTGGSYQAISITYSIDLGDSAKINQDYTVANADYDALNNRGVLKWARHEVNQIKYIELNILNDEYYETREEVHVEIDPGSISPPGAATYPGSSRTRIRINDDDEPPQISIINQTAREQDGEAVIDVEMEYRSQETITVRFETDEGYGGNTVNIDDYDAIADAILTWPANTDGTQSITITLTNDNWDEQPSEILGLRIDQLTGPVGASIITGTAELTITDDDHRPIISPSSQIRTIAENEDTATGILIGSLITANDEDTGDTLASWIISNTEPSGTDSYFAINDGQISLLLGGVDKIDYDSQLGVDPTRRYTLTLTVDDNHGNTSIPGTVFIDVTDVNDEAPRIIFNNGLTIDEGQTEVISTTTHLSVTDVDTADVDANLQFAITTLPTEGTLNLTTFTYGQLQNGDVSYTHTDNNTSGLDSFDFTITDAATNIYTGTFNITVIVVNDPPELDLNGLVSGGINYATTFTEVNPTSIPTSIVNSANLSLTDLDSTEITSALITISNLQDGVDEMLAVNTGATSIVASYDDVNGILQLTNSDTITNYQTVLRTITYVNNSQNLTEGDRNIEFVVTDVGVGAPDEDSTVATSTVTVVATNDLPFITRNNPLTVVEQGTQVISTASHLDVNDYETARNQLQFNVTGIPTSGILSINGATATVGDTFTRQMLANGEISYSHGNNDNQLDAFTFTVEDGDGGVTGSQTFNIDITAVNDPPVLDMGTPDTTYDTSFTEDGPNVPILDGTFSITDSDSPLMSSARITLTNPSGPVAAGELITMTASAITLMNNNGLSWTSTDQSGDKIFVLANNASRTVYETIMKGLVYSSPEEVSPTGTPSRQIRFQVTDDDAGAGNNDESSNVTTTTMTLLPYDDPLLLYLNSPSQNYTPSNIVSNTLTLIVNPSGVNIIELDPDSSNIQIISATITIQNYQVSYGDVLTVTLNSSSGTNSTGAIEVAYNSGILTLDQPGPATETAAHYINALETTRFRTPTIGAPRQIIFILYTAANSSAPVTSTVTVIP